MEALDVNGLRELWNRVDSRDTQVLQVLDMIMREGSDNLFSLQTASAGVGYTLSWDSGVIEVSADGSQRGSNPVILNSNFSLPAGDYFLSGCPNGGGSSTYYLDLQYYDAEKGTYVRATPQPDYGRGREFTLESTTTLRMIFIVPGGGVFNGLIVKPMIKSLSADSTIYVPKFNSLYEMQKKIDELENRIAVLEGSN